jgi:hypothetical protein
MMLIAAITAFGLLFAGVERVQAQDANDPFGSVPTGNFVTPAEAELILAGHVSSMKGVLSTLLPGTNSYAVAERAVVYFNIIQVEVTNGKDVPQSILDGLYFIQNYQTDYGPIALSNAGGASQLDLIGLRNQAINLLEQ